MGFLLSILALAANAFVLVIILQVAMSWLIAFDIVNSDNDAAVRLTTFLKKVTDPVYTPVRKYVPPIGGMDFTPLVIIIGMNIVLSLLVAILT